MQLCVHRTIYTAYLQQEVSHLCVLFYITYNGAYATSSILLYLHNNITFYY